MSTRRFGIELEFGHRRWEYDVISDELDSRVCMEGWGATQDGSGIELKTPPMTWRAWSRVEAVVRELHRLKCYTGRADGLHIHHDMCGRPVGDVSRLARFWLRHQDWVYRLVNPLREFNHFCHPYPRAVFSGATATDWSQILLGACDSQLAPNSYRMIAVLSDKYHGMTFSDLDLWWGAPRRRVRLRRTGRQTVEFRLHEGTLSLYKIKRWVRLTQAIVDRGSVYTGSITPSTLSEFVREVGASNLTPAQRVLLTR